MCSGFLPLTSEEFPNADLTFENHPQAFNLLNLAGANRGTDHSCVWSCQSVLQLRISLRKRRNVCAGRMALIPQKCKFPKPIFQSQISWISCVVGWRKNIEASVKGLISIHLINFLLLFFFLTLEWSSAWSRGDSFNSSAKTGWRTKGFFLFAFQKSTIKIQLINLN